MSTTPAAITSHLHQQMPLTQAMGLEVAQADDRQAIITAPLAPNLNHQQTAFGGSIATLGITVGWVYLHTRLMKLGLTARLIIQKSEVDYLHPVTGDFQGHCTAPSDVMWSEFLQTFHQRGRARIVRTAQILHAGRIAAIHHGTYIAIDESLARQRGVHVRG